MTFLWIEMLWLLLLVPAVVVLYSLIQKRRQKFALRYASLSLVKEAMGHGPGRRRHIPPILFVLALTIMLGALARPTATILLPSNQGTVILTLDVSGSMRADDLKPSRIEAAKAAAKTFVGMQPKNIRIGVVSFSDGASLVQAPTTDREAVIAAINRLTPQRGTAIGRGIVTSLEAIFEEPEPKLTDSTRDSLIVLDPKTATDTLPPGTYAAAIIILMSDGQSNVGPPPLDIIDQASNRGVRVYTVGVGSSDGTVLRFDGRSFRVRLDEDTLKRIASKTDGSYFKADNENDLRKVYETLGTRLIMKAEQTELTAIFTGAAAVLMVLAGLLSILWFGRLL